MLSGSCGVLFLSIPAILSSQYEEPPKEEVGARHVSRLGQGAAGTLRTVQPDQETPGVSGVKHTTGRPPWHSVTTSTSWQSCDRRYTCNTCNERIYYISCWKPYLYRDDSVKCLYICKTFIYIEEKIPVSCLIYWYWSFLSPWYQHLPLGSSVGRALTLISLPFDVPYIHTLDL